MEFEVDYLDELKEKQEQRGRTGFVVQYKYLEAMALLNDEERSEFLLAMYEYDLKGELPELSKRVRAVIKTLKYDIDKTREVWERNNKNSRAKQPKEELDASNNGKAEQIEAPGHSGSINKGVNNENELKPSKAAGSISENAEVKANKGEKKQAADFVPPTVKEVEVFAKANKLNVAAADFVDYYESNGWMVGKNKMNNWKAALSRWSRNERKTNITDISAIKTKGFAQREFDADKEHERRIKLMMQEGERIAKLKQAEHKGESNKGGFQ